MADIIRRQVRINDDIYQETYIEGYYATKDGKVAQIQILPGNDGPELKKFFLMRQENMKGGYKRIEKKHEGHHSVHRLVYSAWGNERLAYDKVIDHKDANPSNNDISNLRQVTQQQNIIHAIENGNFGMNNARPISVYNDETGETKNYDSIKSFLIDIGASEYMIRHNSISDIRKCKKYDKYHVTRIQKC